MKEMLLKLKEIIKNNSYKKYIFMIILFIMYIFLFIYVKVSLNEKNEIKEVEKPEIATKVEKQDEKEYIIVDVKGEVKKEGVYKLEKGSRVNDAIKKAGNLSKDANTRFINLAKELNDGDAIVIYSNKEIKEAEKNDNIVVETPCECEKIKNDSCFTDNTLKKSENNGTIKNDTKNKETKSDENNIVNINTATMEELMTLNGIGEAKAQAIISYREENGGFKSVEDIVNVSGISETIFAKIKENITV